MKNLNTIIASLITGLLALIGVVITNESANKRMANEMKTSGAVTEAKMEELTREVRLHNQFAARMPVVEEKISSLENRVSRLEKNSRGE